MRKTSRFTGIIITVIMICFTGCAGKQTDTNGTISAEEDMNDNQLLSVDDFIRLSGVSAEKYSDIDLQQFIEDYGITESVLTTLNIELLLEEYSSISSIRNVSEVLEDPDIVRTSAFTEGVACIAFYENRNTSVRSAYYDVLNNCCYKLEQGFVFDDLNSVPAEEYTDWQQLLDSLDRNGVFTWESAAQTDGIADPQSMVLAIRYQDGTGFKVAASGILSQLLPSDYYTVRSLLLD